MLGWVAVSTGSELGAGGQGTGGLVLGLHDEGIVEHWAKYGRSCSSRIGVAMRRAADLSVCSFLELLLGE